MNRSPMSGVERKGKGKRQTGCAQGKRKRTKEISGFYEILISDLGTL